MAYILATALPRSKIDMMNPEVAAVVIERRLHRPRNGMPAAWRRPTAARRHPLAAVVKRVFALPRAVARLVTLPIR